MDSNNPKMIFLFSGKRKSGKDFITDQLQQRLSEHGSTIIRLSGPIKHEYAASHNLSEDELLSSSEYKEKYRKDMITWSEAIRAKDTGYFIRAALSMYEGSKFGIWIVSDMRRRSDLEWFRRRFPDRVLTVRICASDATRAQRGYVFTPGVDDAESECDLDGVTEWTFSLHNEAGTDPRSFIDDLVRCAL